MSRILIERLRRSANEMRIEDQNGWPITVDDAADLIEHQSKIIREMSALLKDLDLGRSIHNSRHPDQNIDGPLWAQIPRVLELTNKDTEE